MGVARHADLPVIPSNRVDDLHNLDQVDSADLVLFMAGNQFMVMGDLLEAFRRKHPEVDNIYYETLPPGLELKQILAGGAVFGDRVLDVEPDIYASVNRDAMKRLEDEGFISGADSILYLHNRLVLMVKSGNPLNIESVADLGRDEVRISQPSAVYEDIANYIVQMYRGAGGEDLANRILEVKRAEGTTLFTVVHHRETPLRIMKGTADVGPVWATEVVHAQKEGLAVDAVDVGSRLDQSDKINYYICRLKNSPRRENGDNFLKFITSPEGQRIYQSHGFVPHFPT
jgi:ABC-type molybdate transport system substrate-binding protein